MNREKIRKHRCRNGADAIILKVKSYTAEKIITQSFVKTENEDAKKLLHSYEKMIVMAKVNPKRYKDERDSMQLALANQIHEMKWYREWADFIYFLSTQMPDNDIQNAYKSEQMETWNYLTLYEPRQVHGINRNKELIIGKELFGDWDVPLIELWEKYDAKKITREQLLNGYQMIQDRDNLFQLERNENMVDVCIFEMVPFINERTLTIFPKQWMNMSLSRNWEAPRQWKPTSFYQDELIRRKYLIQRKGCKATFKYAGNIKELFFMEDVTKDKQIIMLYQLTTTKGSFMGYYHLNDQFFFSPYLGSDGRVMHSEVENFVLEVYTDIVCGLERDVKRFYALKEVEDLQCIDNEKHTHVYVQYGLPTKSGESSESSSRRKGFNQSPHERDKAIRRLRPNQEASEEAIERAKEYNIVLQEGFTFVRPYTVGNVQSVRKPIRSTE